MEIYKRLRDYIKKDVKNDNETKRASVIMRVFSLVMCVYFLCQGVSMFLCGEWNCVIVDIVCLIGYAGMFYYTYFNRTQMVLFYVMLSTLGWVLFYVFVFGRSCGAQHFLFVLLVFFFAVSHASAGYKVCMAVGLCLIRLMLLWYTGLHEPLVLLEPQIVFAVQVINTVSIFTLITVIIFLFCQDSLEMERKLVAYNEKLREASLRDPLTKLYNRRAMLEYMNGLIVNLEKHGEWFNVAIGDIDFFKKVNDTYGHEAGDAVLVYIAGLVSGYIKNKGEACRWGGEEFLFVFRGMNGEEAAAHVEKLRLMIEQSEIAYKDQRISVTMTFGLDEYNRNKPIDDTINSADQKLYIGKNTGRNRVIF